MDRALPAVLSSRSWQISEHGCTRRKGRLVGKDAQGRCYYESTGPARRGGGLDRPERWVIYLKGEDPSAVPPEWWGWLHHTLDAPIPDEERKPWQLPYPTQHDRHGAAL